jgi:HPt (histidine-containing phosphotransfer) domain-containing protein
MTEPPVLDRLVIERLAAWGGLDLVSKLVELFQEKAPAKLEAARLALANGDIREVERASHSLKSSAANLGASRLHFLAAEIEELAARGDPASLDPLVARLDGAFAEAVEALAELRAMGDPK